jgi:hypothetical protein
MPKSSSRGGRNESSRNRKQQSDWGVMEMARERPIAAAAAAAGAAAAGLFLWSKRTQISNQLSNLSDQIGDWTQNMASDDTGGLTTTGQTSSQSSTRSQRGMSETGGGNGSVGRRSGGGGSLGSTSGRGRARSTAATQQ